MSSENKPVRTIADIARLVGVSKSTVSRALSDSSLISDKTKDRIRAIAETHNFQIHHGARSLSLKRTNTIAAIFPIDSATGKFITDPFQLEILGAIGKTLGEYDYDLLVAQIQPGDYNWSHRYLDASRADGLILLACCKNDEQIETLAERSVPFILWGPQMPDHSFCTVDSDNVAGGRLATEHLINFGRQRIGFLGGIRGTDAVERRYQGYKMALEAAGRAVDPTLVTYGDYSSEGGYEATRKLLRQVPKLDGLFVNSDLMAFAAMEALRQHGYRVPEDVAVIGYDDIAPAAHSSPPLTTIRQDISRAGELLVKNLMQYLEFGVVTNVLMPAELVIRKSCGADIL
jgi:DNA-binding LacI/PurR family transcriptional regulator